MPTSCKSPTIPGNVVKPGWLTSYSDIKDQFKTGDIILVHGRYPFSWIIEFLQGSEYGHSAMVVRKEDLGKRGEDLPDLLLWEANVLMEDSKVCDLWRKPNKVKEGPMLIDLEQRLNFSQNNYKDVYMVYKPLHIDRSQINFKDVLPQYFDRMIDKGFPNDKEIIASAWLGRKYNRSARDAQSIVQTNFIEFQGGIRRVFENFNPIEFRELNVLEGRDVSKDKIYCSELVADTYKELGILTKTHVSNAYAPVDFSDEGRIRLLNRGWLGSEMFIDMCK